MSEISNGKLPPGVLVPISGGGNNRLYTDAAAAWEQMVAAAAAAGITLRTSGGASGYRSYDQQVTGYNAYKNDPAHNNRHATPGTSEHGFGAALDIDVNDPKVKAWVFANAPRFGFANTVSDEPWHWGHTATIQAFGGKGTGAMPKATVEATASSPSPGGQAMKTLTPEEMNIAAQQFGFAASFLNDPEIGPIIKEAITGQKTQQWLDAKLRTTSWYQNYSASTRAWRQLAENDPASARAQLASQGQAISDRATKLGLQLTPQRVKELAYYSLGFGWTDTQLTDALNAELKYTPEQAQRGQVGATTGTVKALAARYYLNISDEAAFNYARQITSGELDLGGVEATFKGQAKGKFSSIADQIDAGITPADFFDPYKGEIAKLLDVPEASIDLVNDPRWSQVISHAGEGGKLRPMTISEAQTLARSTPQWDKTRGAKSQAADFVEGLAKMFGEVG